MIDSLIFAVPLLAFVVVSLLAFVGCEAATLEGSPPRGGFVMFLHANTRYASPSSVVFSWESDIGRPGSQTIEQPLARLLTIGEEQFVVFRLPVDVADVSEWTVSCSVFTGEAGSDEEPRGVATCGPFEASSLDWKDVTFVYEPDAEQQVICTGVSG